MNAYLRHIIAAAVAVLYPGIVAAQSAAQPAAPSPLLRQGAIVRVWSPELGDRQGRDAVLAAWESDSLALAPAGRRRAGTSVVPVPGAPTHRVSHGSVTRLDVLVPRTRGEGARAGALSGAVMGALGGAALELLFNAVFVAEESWALSLGTGVGVGAALGASAGALRPGARWQRMPLPAP